MWWFRQREISNRSRCQSLRAARTRAASRSGFGGAANCSVTAPWVMAMASASVAAEERGRCLSPLAQMKPTAAPTNASTIKENRGRQATNTRIFGVSRNFTLFPFRRMIVLATHLAVKVSEGEKYHDRSDSSVAS
jgi:hypothetical protein